MKKKIIDDLRLKEKIKGRKLKEEYQYINII